MLETPLGKIEVKLDGEPINYKIITIPTDKTCNELDGRFSIEIQCIPDGKSHRLTCTIINYKPSEADGIESGERLELYSFYKDKIKLSIGMEADIGCLNNGKRISEYDYDADYLKDGVCYLILPTTKTNKFIFGVAWITNVNAENDVQTWYGADPSMFER